jgi:outer membrane protein TolC
MEVMSHYNIRRIVDIYGAVQDRDLGAVGREVNRIEPPAIPVGLPSQLLERRPDIAAFERRVAEANEQIGIARAAYFPSLVLTATAGLEGHNITNWLNWPSRFSAVGPTLAETLFDAGRRRAATDEARANYDASLANYRQTVLARFRRWKMTWQPLGCWRRKPSRKIRRSGKRSEESSYSRIGMREARTRTFRWSRLKRLSC